jgi:5-formyltetrahydrofolate cyclo-ligase
VLINIKKQIRKEIRHKLNKQAREEAVKKSRKIKNRLFSLPEFKKAKTVMLYASKNGEVITDEIIDGAIRAGKRVALPRCTSPDTLVAKEIRSRETDLEKSSLGINEPKKRKKTIQPKGIDIVIVPGVAFDRRNNRLGRGKGFYDKFLKGLPPSKISVGLAFDFQIVENLPKDSHDIPVSKVITN